VKKTIILVGRENKTLGNEVWRAKLSDVFHSREERLSFNVHALSKPEAPIKCSRIYIP